MKFFSYAIILLLVVFGLSFAVLNAEYVTLNYYVGKSQISLSLLLVFTLVLGVVLGMMACFKPWFTLKRQNHSLCLRIKNVEKEVENLRTMPIRDHH